jgi:vanillate/3-O-methylgallate O-demethylase
MLSLCLIDVDWSNQGTKVTVIWGEPGEPQKEIWPVVAQAPYKKDNSRIDVGNL